MTTLPEPNLQWTDHHVKNGVAVVRGVSSEGDVGEAVPVMLRLADSRAP